jgi:AcrR family transcriptional regulator
MFIQDRILFAQMPRRLTQEERREQTRGRLLTAARKVFGREGYGAATLDGIADEAGLSRGALYYNFPGGKRDLFLTLLSERVSGRADALREALDSGGADLAGRIQAAERAAAGSAAAMRENREWWTVFFEFALHAARDRRFARDFARHEGRIRQVLTELIEQRAVALGIEGLPLSPKELALGLTALGNGLALEGIIDDEAVPPELLPTLVGLLVRGILAGIEEGSSPTAEAGLTSAVRP